MLIANPIYDVVFKYLMEDNRIAKILISKIIGEEVETLELLPQEIVTDVEAKKELWKQESEGKIISSITIYRLDFSAKIKTLEGKFKHVIIEIQKAKFPTDIMRFRKYLGQQYSSEKTVETINERKMALPIISIYFLGHKLDKTEVPVIKVNRAYIDVATGREIKDREEFIECLTHNSFIIQIPHLKNKRRNELEKLLSIFDQENIGEDHHVLNVNDEDFPEELKIIIRRLQNAIMEPQIRKTMDIEDEILTELGNKERAITKRDEIINEKMKIIEEKDKLIEEKDKLIEHLKRRLEQKGPNSDF
jgi:hypothetical protein